MTGQIWPVDCSLPTLDSEKHVLGFLVSAVPSLVPGIDRMLSNVNWTGSMLAPLNQHLPRAYSCFYSKYNQVAVKHFQFCIQQMCFIWGPEASRTC